MSMLSETGQFMISTYYVRVRNRKILLASIYMPHERERTSGSQENQTFNFLFYWLLFSISDLYSASSVESRIFIFMSGSWLHVNIFQTECFQALIIGIHIEG